MLIDWVSVVSSRTVQKIGISAKSWNLIAYVLLASNHMIFLLQFGLNKHSLIFQRLLIALALQVHAMNNKDEIILINLFCFLNRFWRPLRWWWSSMKNQINLLFVNNFLRDLKIYIQTCCIYKTAMLFFLYVEPFWKSQ